MTEAELIAGAIVTGSAGLGGVLKWAVSRVTGAIDKNTEALAESAKQSAVHAETNRQLTTKLEHIEDWIEQHTPVENPQQPAAAQAPRPTGAGARRATPAKGTYVIHNPRASSRGDE